MNLEKNTYPNLNNKECKLILLSEWIGEEADLIKSTDAAMDEVETFEWPAGLISYSCLMSKDKQKVLHCVQWNSIEDHLNYVESQLPTRLQNLEGKIIVKSHHSFGRFRMKESKINKIERTPDYIFLSLINSPFELKDNGIICSENLLENIDNETYMKFVEFKSVDDNLLSLFGANIYSLLRSLGIQ